MSSFIIKIIAVSAMLLDHTRLVFPDVFPLWFRVVGRLAFPLFAYLIAEGFRHTRSPERFLSRLLLFAVISEPFFRYAFADAIGVNTFGFVSFANVFFTLFLGGTAIFAYRYVMDRWNVASLAILPAAVCVFLGGFLSVDYSWKGVLFIFAMYAVKKTHTRLVVMAGMCLLIWLPVFVIAFTGGVGAVTGTNYAMIAATLLTVPLAASYNGKRGYPMKWFFYAFYPVHLAGFGGVFLLLAT
ncbi:MAG: conjugal transfer protein TraX [Defluviitaleaceae bacterium]|nr:conjugal transfer protein TraX [Defluviitaleaceae bacterium]